MFTHLAHHLNKVALIARWLSLLALRTKTVCAKSINFDWSLTASLYLLIYQNIICMKAEPFDIKSGNVYITGCLLRLFLLSIDNAC